MTDIYTSPQSPINREGRTLPAWINGKVVKVAAVLALTPLTVAAACTSKVTGTYEGPSVEVEEGMSVMEKPDGNVCGKIAVAAKVQPINSEVSTGNSAGKDFDGGVRTVGFPGDKLSLNQEATCDKRMTLWISAALFPDGTFPKQPVE